MKRRVQDLQPKLRFILEVMRPQTTLSYDERRESTRMHIKNIPFGITDWETVPTEIYTGDSGCATWRTRHFGEIRVRLVDYSPGYRANHWCAKGHIIFCLSGEMTTDLMDGRSFLLKAGQSYQVADDDGQHRSHTEVGARLFIVD